MRGGGGGGCTLAELTNGADWLDTGGDGRVARRAVGDRKVGDGEV